MARGRPDVNGHCHLCGAEGKLSFEHVPPKSAFNARKVYVQRGQELVTAVDLETVRRVQFQSGVGANTLCESCNNNTGAWYGRPFADFARQAVSAIRIATGARSTLCYEVRPLCVSKQVVCMFFSINGPGFREDHPELERFVLDKHAVGLPPRYQVYAYLNPTSHGRSCGVTAAIDIAAGTARYVSEISLCPLGIVLSIDSFPPKERLADITFMASHQYEDRLHVELSLPLLSAYSPFPLDFRDRETLESDRDESIALSAKRSAGA